MANYANELKGIKIFEDLSRVAGKLGYECYVVGGWVRDLILGKPSDDIDIVVVGSGVTMATSYARYLGPKVKVDTYPNFGTAKVNVDGLEVEFVGARRESYERGSRKPIVEDGTLTDDLTRRDFTLNALAICLNQSRFGELVDMFGGLSDLQAGILRTPVDPTITFSDDPLRMLRCIRFAVRFGFEIDPVVYEAIKINKDRLKIVSPERIMVELNKILLSPDPKRGMICLQETGLLGLILPEVSVLDTNDRQGDEYKSWHKNNFWHSINVLANVAEKSDKLWLRWSALLHDIGKHPTKKYSPEEGWTFHGHEVVGAGMVEKIFRRLKLPLGDSELGYVRKMIDMHMRPSMISTSQITDSAVRRLLADAGDDIDDLLILCRSDLTTQNDEKKARILHHFDKLEAMIEDLKKRDYKRLFQPCIDGYEIMRIFNLKSGPEVGILKKTLKDAVLDGIVENEPEALKELLCQKAKEIGLLI